MNEFADERDELCRRFRESLSKPLSERFYDEDQLVDLFDYSGDLNDDYLRMEILLSGARLYPDSEPLRLRRAIFYGGFEDDTQAKFFQDNNGVGALWDILRLRYSDLRGDELKAEFDRLLEEYPKFDDEEIIQFVDVCEYHDLYDWLIEKLPVLEAHTDFPMTLYFEVGAASEEVGRFDKAIEMFEHLTDEDPSNPEHWFMLAQDYNRLDRADDALNAIEFALALQPKNTQMRAFRASIFLKLQRSLPLALKELDEIRQDFPDDPELIELYVNTNDLINGEDDTLQKLRQMSVSERPSYGALTLYLLRGDLQEDKIEELMDRFYDVNQSDGTNTRANWIAWSRFFLDTGFRNLAFLALYRYSQKSNDTLDDVPDYLLLASLQGRNDIALTQITRMQARSGDDFYKASPALSVVYLIQMLRHADFDAVDEFLAGIDLADYGNPDEMSTDELVSRKFLLLLASDLIKKMQSAEYRKPELWKSFDPLS